jgi:predicted PolB exonuclease-like 3'-5' exonuclease
MAVHRNPYFIDVETVPVKASWNELDERTQEVYFKRFKAAITEMGNDGHTNPFEDHWKANAALHAEWGKIVCVSVGIVTKERQLRVKTIAPEFVPGSDERDQEITILHQTSEIIKGAPFLCAHNGKEFDFPYLCRRMMVNNLPIPDVLRTEGKKAWEILNEDTMDIWGNGQWKYKVSLDCLANVLRVASSKNGMDGGDVAKIYYEPCPKDVLPFDHEKAKMLKIGTYCAGDIVALANVWMKLRREPVIESGQIIYV